MLHLTNTATRRKEPFTPIDADQVRMYVCGPTVYQRIHVGNARPLVVFDVLFRLLRHLYGPQHVTYVRNITDVEDKIIAQAAANGEAIDALTERTAAQFRADWQALGCLEPTFEPRATEHLPGMIALIEALIGRGHAYEAQGHVLFDVPSMPDYGRLSGRNREEMIAGARVDVAPYKRDPADFVLWKPAGDGEPGWDSPWGRGRPGWHIECSAMSEALLGPLPFDIHGGGIDLVFPHHENELAQSCCARRVPEMARYWLHNGFVDMRGEKMSKSTGNVLRVDEALSQADSAQTRQGEIIRFWLLSSHYRDPLDLRDTSFREAKASLNRIYRALEYADGASSDRDSAVVQALFDDINTPRAIARLHELTTEVHQNSGQIKVALANTLWFSGELLGILGNSAETWRTGEKVAIDPITSRIIERQEARRLGNYLRADQIRAELAAEGILVEDTPQGARWRSL